MYLVRQQIIENKGRRKKILKTTRVKRQITYKGPTIKPTATVDTRR